MMGPSIIITLIVLLVCTMILIAIKGLIMISECNNITKCIIMLFVIAVIDYLISDKIIANLVSLL